MFDCYAQVFKRETANVSGITQKEKDDIYKLISNSDGGFLNMGAYHTQIYEQYFKAKDWAWLEYNKWNDKFTKLGRYPTAFKPKIDLTITDTALSFLSVADLKDWLKSNNIEFSSKSKKQDLIGLANGISNLGNHPTIKAKIEDALEKERHDIYVILMRTINFRGKCLYEYNRAKKIGVKKFKIVQTFETDKEFADIALKENPNALPPLYPYDLSWLKPIVDFE